MSALPILAAALSAALVLGALHHRRMAARRRAALIPLARPRPHLRKR
ncbi:hypothetical protein [Zoogloea dura]|uniref:Uncharacterized protein n=1 Tax=Zoogloea dura TaxID=2728840 RepID=A0A848GBM0_9RHOO|nr:hypothetical protein [Zoogloea dura]NML28704.1 hypothetical protein [Zoogloea dura]